MIIYLIEKAENIDEKGERRRRRKKEGKNTFLLPCKKAVKTTSA